MQLSLDTSALEAFTTSAAARADALDAALREGLGELRAGAEVASADAQKVRACASLRRGCVRCMRERARCQSA